MKIAEFKYLAQKSFKSIIFNKRNIRNGTMMGFFACFILNSLSSYWQIKTLDLLQALMKSKNTLQFSEMFPEYFKYTILVIASKYIYRILTSFLMEKVSEVLMAQFLIDAMGMPYFNFVKTNSGQIIAEITDKKELYCSFFKIFFFDVVSLFIFSLFSFYKMLKSSNIFFILAVSIYPVLFIYIDICGLKALLKLNKSYFQEKRKNSCELLDKIQNFEIIKSFNTQKEEGDDFYRRLETEKIKRFNLKKYVVNRRFLLSLFTEIPFLMIILILKRSGFEFFENFATILMIIKTFNKRLLNISYLTNKVALSINKIEKGERFASIDDSCIEFNETISFESVSIYHGEFEVLKNINLLIKKGEKIAIVGKNGTGKSTLIKSLIKFTESRGKISIDGVDTNPISPISLFKIISYVSQDDYMANASVLSNIKIGNKLADEAKIKQVAELLGVNGEFESLENGYETSVGVGGTKISAGQKQKISLVRAIIKEAPILILDEATSLIDKNYEELIVKVLTKLEDKTLLMIIHQKSLMKNFDKIIFLDSGIVEAFGSYSELLKENENFREFCTEPEPINNKK